MTSLPGTRLTCLLVILEKTEVIHFSSRFLNNPSIQQFSFSNASIELADEVSDLAVVLDHDLDLRSQLQVFFISHCLHGICITICHKFEALQVKYLYN